MNLKKIGSDKIKHFGLCGFIVLATGYLGAPLAFLVAMVVGFVKEIHDQFFKENSPFSWADILADFIGATVGALALVILLWIKKLIG